MKIPEGYRIATMGDRATHAICRKHGKLVKIDASDHTCSWLLLVKEEK